MRFGGAQHQRDGEMPINITVLTTIIVLVPMFYLLLASPAFLLVHLGIPQVAQLLRAMFSGYFLVLVVAGLIAVTLSVLDGRLVPAIVTGLLTSFVVAWRAWMMRRVNAVLVEIQAGREGAAARLRRLHWIGMATNALQTATMVTLIPQLVVAM
jgi:hypothetical protein